MSQLPNFLQVRAVVLVNFPAQIPPGREQENTRPAVIVALPNVTGITRFSLVIVVPLTTQQGDWATRNSTLYPQLQAGMGNIRYDSTVLLDQIRAVDIKRVLGYRGDLTAEEYQPIANGLKAMFCF
ncbi:MULTISPECIES: type II toxin-antitoxin system PemK/MazF family toxin [unclassified Microcoleus]|uniref:type II toxin-antitoxin system PemK/MazF family toxin n=1 Tax=unclassified Microcoleus TaxID=2642155 RepID=UPI002FD38607